MLSQFYYPFSTQPRAFTYPNMKERNGKLVFLPKSFWANKGFSAFTGYSLSTRADSIAKERSPIEASESRYAIPLRLREHGSPDIAKT